MRSHPTDADADGPQQSREDHPQESPAARVRPERPKLAPAPPPPVEPKLPPTPTVRIARAVGTAAIMAGVASVLFAYFGANARIDALKTIASGLATGDDQATIDSVALLTFWVTLGSMAFVTIAEAICLGLSLDRHGSARWVLLGILPLHVGSFLLVDAFLAMDEGGRLIGLLAAAHLVLQAATVALLLLPGSSRWFRRQSQPPPARL